MTTGGVHDDLERALKIVSSGRTLGRFRRGAAQALARVVIQADLFDSRGD
jgi:hypothetical protein